MHNLDFEAAVRSSAFQPLGSLAEFVFRGYSESLEEVLQHAETILEKRLVYSHGTIQVLDPESNGLPLPPGAVRQSADRVTMLRVPRDGRVVDDAMTNAGDLLKLTPLFVGAATSWLRLGKLSWCSQTSWPICGRKCPAFLRTSFPKSGGWLCSRPSSCPPCMRP
jgi:hypothetical protein